MKDPPEELPFHISTAPATETGPLSEVLPDVLCSSSNQNSPAERRRSLPCRRLEERPGEATHPLHKCMLGLTSHTGSHTIVPGKGKCSSLYPAGTQDCWSRRFFPGCREARTPRGRGWASAQLPALHHPSEQAHRWDTALNHAEEIPGLRPPLYPIRLHRAAQLHLAQPKPAQLLWKSMDIQCSSNSFTIQDINQSDQLPALNQ